MFLEFTILAVSLVLIWIILDNHFPSKKLPPGPYRFPLVGTALQIVRSRPKPPFVYFRDVSRKYGPLTHLRMGADPAVVIDDFDIAKSILNSEIWIDRPFDPFVLERSFGLPLGIIFVSGDGWREMRRFSMRTLRDFGYGKQTSMQGTIDDEVKDLLTQVEQVANQDKPYLKMKHLFTMPVLNILWSMVSSNVRTSEDDAKMRQLSKLVDDMVKATPMGGTVLDIFPWLRHVAPDMSGATFIRKCFKGLQDHFREVLESRRQEGVHEEDKRDFIDMFINEIEKHKKLGSNPNHYTDEQFITTVTDLFEAGSETSSNTLEFAIYFAMKNPRVQRKVQKEIDRVVGRSRLPNMADRSQMPYTEATLIEVQRMANVLPMTARSPTQDTSLNGYFIEKGTLGIVNIYSFHMDEKFWGDPWEFRPERFLDGQMKIISERANRVIPFGAGKRVCLGEQMARTTLFAYFTAFLQNYTFDEVPEEKDVNEMPLSKCDDPEFVLFQKYVHVGFTLSPHPFQAKITKRH